MLLYIQALILKVMDGMVWISECTSSISSAYGVPLCIANNVHKNPTWNTVVIFKTLIVQSADFLVTWFIAQPPTWNLASNTHWRLTQTDSFLKISSIKTDICIFVCVQTFVPFSSTSLTASSVYIAHSVTWFFAILPSRPDLLCKLFFSKSDYQPCQLWH